MPAIVVDIFFGGFLIGHKINIAILGNPDLNEVIQTCLSYSLAACMRRKHSYIENLRVGKQNNKIGVDATNNLDSTISRFDMDKYGDGELTDQIQLLRNQLSKTHHRLDTFQTQLEKQQQSHSQIRKFAEWALCIVMGLIIAFCIKVLLEYNMKFKEMSEMISEQNKWIASVKRDHS